MHGSAKKLCARLGMSGMHEGLKHSKKSHKNLYSHHLCEKPWL